MYRLALATGAEVWQHRLGADVTLPPAVGSGVVVAMDRGGTVTALDEVTGQRRWTKELEGKGAGFVGTTLVVLQDQTAHGLDPTSGDRRWLRPFFGTFTEVAPLADRLVLATESATVLLDEAGRVTARLPGYLRLTLVGRPDRGLGSTRGRGLRPFGVGPPALAAARPDPRGAGPAGGRVAAGRAADQRGLDLHHLER